MLVAVTSRGALCVPCVTLVHFPQVVRDHFADAYGLDSHPRRPFVFASSSRDTTLRFWNMHGPADVLKVRTCHALLLALASE